MKEVLEKKDTIEDKRTEPTRFQPLAIAANNMNITKTRLLLMVNKVLETTPEPSVDCGVYNLAVLGDRPYYMVDPERIIKHFYAHVIRDEQLKEITT